MSDDSTETEDLGSGQRLDEENMYIPNMLQEYYTFQVQTSWYKHAGEANAPELNYLCLGLGGETGEFLDEVKKIVRRVGYLDEDEFKYELLRSIETLTKEAGDILWYLNKICNEFLGLSIEELAALNTAKLYERMRGMEDKQMPLWPFTDPEYSQEKLRQRFSTAFDEFTTEQGKWANKETR